MSDLYIDSNPWFPNDLWGEIASYLHNNDLATFKKIFENIKNKQLEEIAYLTEHHAKIVAKPEYAEVLQNTSSVTLALLESREKILDAINCEIIQKKINLDSSLLILVKIGITRLPTTLFQKPDYVNYWKKLTHLYCNENEISSLDLQKLESLQFLICRKNKLTSLNIQGLRLKSLACDQNLLTFVNLQGLVTLRRLNCSHNQLISLNLEGLMALEKLDCDNNPLKTLILTGAHPNITNKYAELERSLLLKNSSESSTETAAQLENNSNIHMPTCLSFSSNKRKRNNEDSMQEEPKEFAEEPSEDSEQEPEKKRFKKF